MEPIILTGLEPKVPLGYFEKFCSIPRGSGNTKGISDYLASFAKDHEPVTIQGHIDMVCEKDVDMHPKS